MRMKQKSIVYMAANSLMVGVSVHAGTIDTVGVMSEQAHQIVNDGGGSFRSRTTLSAPAPTGSFTHNFSVLGETTWNVIWQAPVDQFIQVDVPLGYDDYDIEFNFRANNLNSEPVQISGLAMSTDQQLISGSPALVLESQQMSLSGPAGHRADAFTMVEDTLVPGQTYQFNSITLSFLIPENFNVDYNVPVFSFDLQGTARFRGVGTAPSNTDPWISVVPEPTSLALLGLGSLLLARRRR